MMFFPLNQPKKMPTNPAQIRRRRPARFSRKKSVKEVKEEIVEITVFFPCIRDPFLLRTFDGSSNRTVDQKGSKSHWNGANPAPARTSAFEAKIESKSVDGS